jgi:PAS domain S-box-containing protein
VRAVADIKQLRHGLPLRSLVTRLLLAAAPVALVVALLVGWSAAPLLRAPSDLAQAERDLVQVQRYQALLNLIDEQTLHWWEYQYLPRPQLGAIRDEIETVEDKIASLRREWPESTTKARMALSTYDLISVVARTSIESVDAGRSEEALRLMTTQVLPVSETLVADLQDAVLDRASLLGDNVSELAGNVRGFLGTDLATRLREFRYEITELIGVARVEDLVVREAAAYAKFIATGSSGHLEAVGLAALVSSDLARIEHVAAVSGEPAEQKALHELSGFNARVAAIGERIRVLTLDGQQARAADVFESELDPVMLDELLPSVSKRVAGDRKELATVIRNVDARANRVRIEIALGGVLLMLVLLIPILLIGRSIVRPLRRIRRAADEVASGDLKARTGVTGTSEVGELALAFDAMATRVEQSRASLMSTAVMEASSDLLLIVRDGIVTYASGASTSLLGMPSDAVAGSLLGDLVHPDDAPELLAAGTGSENAVVQVRFEAWSGWVDTEVAVVDLRADPEVRGLALSIRDVTERKLAEVALEEARDAAVEGSRLKSNFLATMSHEIRTPMNGVIGLTGLLLTTELDERQAQYAQGVRGAGEALLAIINDILDFSKVEAGKLELEEIDFDLVQVVEEAAVLVADAAQQKGVELLAYCSPDLPLGVRGDPSRVRQVLLNLVSNAVKFTDSGEVVVRGLLEGENPDGVTVRFEVTDTGIGIPEASRQGLFDPFTQADSSTTREFGGTGLGLAISHRLVNAMGGAIGVDSEVGRGSTFWFSLPLRLAHDATSTPRRATGRLTGRRALIVDDNDTNCLILADQLGAWGIRSDAVGSGAEALGALREAVGLEEPYDFALLDFCMPLMDGLELARRISADSSLSGTGLLLLTSAMDITTEQARAAGVEESLTKPVRLSHLHSALQNVQNQVLVGRVEGHAAPAAVAGTRGHLLVVEDNPTNQLVAVGILASLGFTAEVAGNGLEALQALDRREFAAVLMDCHMPVMDGYSATRQIRQDEGEALHTPIIAMTAGAVLGDRELCIAAGMDDYVSKPVTPESIDLVLTRWLEQPNLA